MKEQHSSHLRKICVYLCHQILNLRKENMLSTLERRCTWSAKRTWILLKWILWRRREVLRQSNSQRRSADAWRRHSLSKNGIYSWQWKSSRMRQQFYRSDSFAMNTDTHTSGSTVRNHTSLKTGFGHSATQRTSFRSWFQACQRVLPPVFPLQHPWHLQGRRLIILHLPQGRLPHQPWLCQATVRLEHGKTCVWWSPVQYLCQVNMLKGKNGETRCGLTSKNPKPNKNEDHDLERWDPLYSDIPERLQEVRENLVGHRVPEHRDSHASSSHEPSLEPMRCVDLGNHSIKTHFPKDRNCEICQRTKITRAPCRRRIVVPRAEILVIWIQQITKFFVKLVNLETIIDMQSWCKTWPPYGSSRIRAKQTLLRKHKGACKSSWSQIGSLKSFTLLIPWNLAKLVKIFPGIIVRRHHTDQEQMGLLKEQCAE